MSGSIERFRGTVFCHVPASAPFRVHELASFDDPDDRWGVPGRRTIHLAGDPGVALAEYGRNVHARPAEPDERRILALELGLVRLLDLRDGRGAATLGLPDWPTGAADRTLAREVALKVRAMHVCDGLLVPSVAFLDDPARFNVVLFHEVLDQRLDDVLRDPAEVGRLQLGAA